MALECNIYDTERLTLAEIWDQEVAAEEQWEAKITELAARNEDGYWERWSIAAEHMAGMELLVAQLEEKTRLQREDVRLVAVLGRKLNKLRFGEQTKRIVAFPHHNPEREAGGCIEFKTVERRLSQHRDGIYISATAWKKMRNRLNALMGSSTRYPVTVREKREPLDALEVAVYGLYLDGTSS